LKNLVDNAIKFTPDGGDIRVTTVHSSDSNAETILVSVSDTGPGISEKLQPQIFDQFVTGSHVASGSGLGLAFCKMALAAHGQDVWIDDESEHGATFTFSLPFAPSDAN
ncbi:MAG: ATP-binding protein, partial [Chloroflexi bacterium]|nr:ATP-binding protein [Chloroflexota bacterium]